MKFKEYVQKAIEIRDTSSAWYRQRAEQIRSEISQAKLDRDLSAEGRLKKVAQIRQQRGDELLREVKALRDEYVQALQQAKVEAEKTLKSAVKKPSDEKITDFQRQFKRFKTELMLTNRFDTIEKKLNDFLSQQVDEPYFAQLLADEFPEIISQSLAVADEPAKARMKLADIFDRLNNDFLPEEAKEARNALEFANASLANPKIFSPVVETNAMDLLGPVGKYMNDPETYLQGGEQ
jgi:hypothetical protein